MKNPCLTLSKRITAAMTVSSVALGTVACSLFGSDEQLEQQFESVEWTYPKSDLPTVVPMDKMLATKGIAAMSERQFATAPIGRFQDFKYPEQGIAITNPSNGERFTFMLPDVPEDFGPVSNVYSAAVDYQDGATKLYVARSKDDGDQYSTYPGIDAWLMQKFDVATGDEEASYEFQSRNTPTFFSQGQISLGNERVIEADTGETVLHGLDDPNNESDQKIVYFRTDEGIVEISYPKLSSLGSKTHLHPVDIRMKNAKTGEEKVLVTAVLNKYSSIEPEITDTKSGFVLETIEGKDSESKIYSFDEHGNRLAEVSLGIGGGSVWSSWDDKILWIRADEDDVSFGIVKVIDARSGDILTEFEDDSESMDSFYLDNDYLYRLERDFINRRSTVMRYSLDSGEEHEGEITALPISGVKNKFYISAVEGGIGQTDMSQDPASEYLSGLAEFIERYDPEQIWDGEAYKYYNVFLVPEPNSN